MKKNNNRRIEEYNAPVEEKNAGDSEHRISMKKHNEDQIA
jgi:hypothetical protein